MRKEARIAVIIPALNEEQAIGKVISAIPEWVDDIVVVDNGSTDATATVARSHGARVLHEPERGYGAACLKGITALDKTDIVVFLDGDFSDHPDEMGLLVDPVVDGEADMVIGSRAIGRRERGALTPQARFGNWLSCALMRLIWGVRFTDLGPFRAIDYRALLHLRMCDRNYGWTVEMQIKAASQGLRSKEVPVSYRRRIGRSKVSGTIRGIVGAGTKILYTIFREAILSFSRRNKKSRNRLIVFTKYPEPGKTKTRLIPLLGTNRAADLQRRMTEHLLARIERIRSSRLAFIEICYEGGSKTLMGDWLGKNLTYRPQGDGDLGERMSSAFRDAFAAGSENVVIVGSDIPGITGDIVQEAFDKLAQKDLVLGPANDGGYYLIGMNRKSSIKAIPELFSGLKWGTNEVLGKTLEITGSLGLSVCLLEPLDDIDRPEDLPVWERETGKFQEKPDVISVIIPALNEADNISRALSSVCQRKNLEVIVVDGGSSDGTIEMAESLGAKVLRGAPPRARQMNIGAMAAKGAILLFLHADTALPDRFEESVRNTMALPGVAAGAFELKIDSSIAGLRAVERVTNFRSRRMAMPYGDQAIFIRTDVFRGMKGFPDIAIMEDFELMRRLRRITKVKILSQAVRTSARRWERLGVIRTTVVNQLVIAGYYLGVAPARLARLYEKTNGAYGTKKQSHRQKYWRKTSK